MWEDIADMIDGLFEFVGATVRGIFWFLD